MKQMFLRFHANSVSQKIWGDNAALKRAWFDTFGFSCMVVEERHTGRDIA